MNAKSTLLQTFSEVHRLETPPACIMVNPYWPPFGLSRISRGMLGHLNGIIQPMKAGYIKPLPLMIIDIGHYRPTACPERLGKVRENIVSYQNLSISGTII
ncbi:hypothetical protein [Motilimonas eburnea]|uniref:hypothetical protein n=1 Tax=Motilimonas eburnea TaxID=1737488 RepID=UPI001E3A409D|nr:hypothetical protein [Motilimonas eburnea]MCE2571835.1 hypothetical protein [Motilimonas eburnea]